MSTGRIAWALVVSSIGIWLVTTAPLLAQDAPYRLRLAALVAELDTCTTPASVEGIAASRPPVRSDGVGNLEEGFITLRLGVLRDDEHLIVDAWGDLERVADVRPSWPWAQLGVAMAALELYSRRSLAPARYKGSAGGTHYDGFIYEMKEMLRREPAFGEGLAWLVASLDADGDRNQPPSMMRLLVFAVDSVRAPVPPETYLVLARYRRAGGAWNRATEYLSRYLAADGDSGIGFLEQARTLAAAGALTSAVEHYEAGLNVATRSGRLFYLEDLEWVATDGEMRYIEDLPFDAQPDAIRRFWRKRDDRDLRDYGDRVREHLRRWAFVHENFRVDFPERRTVFKDVFISTARDTCLKEGAVSLDDYSFRDPSRAGRYRRVERILDHRAVIYMRHGEPFMQIGGALSGQSGGYDRLGAATNTDLPPEAGLPGGAPVGAAEFGREGESDPLSINPYRLDRNTTWVYLLDGAVRVFSFYGHPTMGTHRPTTLIVHQAPIVDVLLQLSAVSPTYARMAGLAQFALMGASLSQPIQCMQAYQQTVQEQRDGTAIAIRTDTYLKRFAEAVLATMQAYAMGQPAAGTGQLVAAVAVEPRTLVEDTTSDSLVARYRVRIEIAAIDSITGRSVRTARWRTVERARADTTRWRQWILTLPLPPGLGEVRLGITQDTLRGVLLAASVQPAGRPTPLAISDLMVGVEGGPAWSSPAGIAVPLSAFVGYREGEVISIYHEIYGATPGESYETRLTLYTANRERVATTLTFVEQASTPTMTARRSLSLAQVRPGDYRLRVEVVGRPGTHSVWRERPVTVLQP